MITQTNTLTRISTITHTDVRHVIWKIRADLTQLRIFSRLFTIDYENNTSNDLFQWTYSGYADAIFFEFYASDNICKYAVKYTVQRGYSVTTNDDAGNLPFYALSYLNFRVRIGTNPSWLQLTDIQRQAFYATLSPGWGPSKDSIRYGNGNWTTSNVYSSNGLSANRSVFMLS